MNANLGSHTVIDNDILALRLSKHATVRARERVGWDKGALQRTARIALSIGVRASQIDRKSPRSWMMNLCLGCDGCFPVLHAGVIFVFRTYINDQCFTLLTLYKAPRELLRCLHNSKMFVNKHIYIGMN